ncbi:hypothetical protein, partial [Ralstonia solanacearum]
MKKFHTPHPSTDEETPRGYVNFSIFAEKQGVFYKPRCCEAKNQTKQRNFSPSTSHPDLKNFNSTLWTFLTLPLRNESLAEPINSSKERSNDKQGKAGAVHARIQAGGG